MTIKEAAHALWERTVGRNGERSNVTAIGIGEWEGQPAIHCYVKKLPKGWTDKAVVGDEEGYPVVAHEFGEFAPIGPVD